MGMRTAFVLCLLLLCGATDASSYQRLTSCRRCKSTYPLDLGDIIIREKTSGKFRGRVHYPNRLPTGPTRPAWCCNLPRYALEEGEDPQYPVATYTLRLGIRRHAIYCGGDFDYGQTLSKGNSDGLPAGFTCSKEVLEQIRAAARASPRAR